ncbi:MAG: M15 family metallopeptidase [Gaiellaceae bacterium]
MAFVLAAFAVFAPASFAAPELRGTGQRISPELQSRMSSLRPDCPLHIRDLRLLRVSHWGYEGEVHRGRLIVNRWQAWPVVRVLKRLYANRYPIRRLWLIDAYRSNDRRSMAANNTSAFNCRYVAGTTRWSEHAYGRALDINPVQNPFVASSGRVSPPSGTAFADRSKRAKGMIRARDAVVRAFASIGWRWGGSWGSPKDYQHFSATGR